MTGFMLELTALSFKATLVAAVVLIAQFLLRRWLPAGFRYALWALVAVRLLVPALPQSPISILQTAQPATALPGLAPWLPGTTEGAAPEVLLETTVVSGFDASAWLLGVWLAVAVLLLLRRAIGARRLGSVLRRARSVSDTHTVSLLEACCRDLGIKRDVRLLESAEVQGPSACGTIRPAILVPLDFTKQLDEAQQRHALLHELSHLERHDAAALQLAHLLMAFHWFNPFLWLALRRFETDLEMACDATVLSHLALRERPAYGKTLLEVGVRPLTAVGPCFAVDSRNQLTRRIQMITRFQPRSWRRTLVLACLAATLTVATLTDIPSTVATAAVSPTDATTLAQSIAAEYEKMDRNEQDAMATATRITELVEGSPFEEEVLFAALQTEADRLDQADQAKTAGMVRGLVDIFRQESSNPRPPRISNSAETTATVRNLRNAGTALYRNILVPSFGIRPPGPPPGWHTAFAGRTAHGLAMESSSSAWGQASSSPSRTVGVTRSITAC